MSATLPLVIPHASLEVHFEQHLVLPNNKRILFSGPFGTGKSTFLKEFTEKKSEDFFYVKIFPVNYSVSANEDVFELIKFDLLMQLMGNHYEEIALEKEDFTLLLKSQVFIMERMKFMPLLYAIIGLSEKIGQPVGHFLNAFEKTVDDYKDFNRSITIDEDQDITKFLEGIENKKGSGHEMDAISELIFDIVQRIKSRRSETETKSVLIIDDLDRLDPEHIFRLFNIFSAHHDEVTDTNKFGFDKVIFVCDIENIRKIFHHRYGAGVDFSGYIDKFYSLSPFDFDNRKFVKQKINALIDRIQFHEELRYYQFSAHHRFRDTVKAVVLSLIDARLLNLRMILQYPQFKMDEFSFGSAKFTQRTTIVPIIVLFYFLKNFYGSFDLLHSKLKFLFENFDQVNYRSHYHEHHNVSNDSDIQNIVSFSLAFILPEELAFESHNQTLKSYLHKGYNCYIEYNGISRDYVAFKNFQKAIDITTSEEISLNPYKVMLDAFETCRRLGCLK